MYACEETLLVTVGSMFFQNTHHGSELYLTHVNSASPFHNTRRTMSRANKSVVMIILYDCGVFVYVCVL